MSKRRRLLAFLLTLAMLLTTAPVQAFAAGDSERPQPFSAEADARALLWKNMQLFSAETKRPISTYLVDLRPIYHVGQVMRAGVVYIGKLACIVSAGHGAKSV